MVTPNDTSTGRAEASKSKANATHKLFTKYFFAARTFAHLALAAALILAQHAFWAAAILALPAALMPPFFFGALATAGAAAALGAEPSNWPNCFSRPWTCSLRLAACLSCAGVRLIIFMM